LEPPQYKETGNVGPAHAKVFTIQCLVSTFVEEGIATTKKQAKHEAARKMIDRIKEVVSDVEIQNLNKTKNKIDEIQNKLALARYSKLFQLKTESIKLKVNWGSKFIDYHKISIQKLNLEEKQNFVLKLDEFEEMKRKCEATGCKETFIQFKQEFDKYLELIEIPFYYFVIQKNPQLKKFKFVVALRLNTTPDIFEIAIGETKREAEANVIEEVIKTFRILL
jgi:dsRNA-specific ribonuclease